ncbi:hypothetical protein KSS91_08360 [Pseudomonas azerbaijanorientalis]|nr:hypothetical protein KSS91_08360 [Pseudomonas azerbaijanorientalis]
MCKSTGAPLFLASTRSISVSGSAFVHVTDAADVFAPPTENTGFRP